MVSISYDTWIKVGLFTYLLPCKNTIGYNLENRFCTKTEID
jgi:hypothetical protein